MKLKFPEPSLLVTPNHMYRIAFDRSYYTVCIMLQNQTLHLHL